MITTNERLLKTKEVAARLKISPITVCAHVSHGLIKVHDRVGTAMLFTESEIQRFEANRRGPGNPNFLKSKSKPKPARRKSKSGSHASV